MRIERGDVFVNTGCYHSATVCICIGVRDKTVWYLEIGELDRCYHHTCLALNDLWLGYTRSRIKCENIDSVAMKVPLTHLDRDGLASYNHIKTKFMDTNII
jgi:hypothetical protein